MFGRGFPFGFSGDDDDGTMSYNHRLTNGWSR